MREVRDNVPIGIAFMIGATLLFAGSNAIAKWQVADYPPGEVLFFRSLATFVIVALFLLPRKGLAAYATNMPAAHFARGLTQSISQGFTVLALALLPLAAATTISFSAPLFATCAAAIFLREKFSADRMAFLVLGFAGVLIVASPGGDLPLLGVAFALANAIMYGGVTAAVRGMSKTETAESLLMWQVTIVMILHALLLPLGFRGASGADLAMLLLSGVANAAAQYCWTRALVLAPASAVSPFYYLLLVWSIVLGYLAWGEIPGPALILGSSVIVLSGLLLLWRETRARVGTSGGLAGKG